MTFIDQDGAVTYRSCIDKIRHSTPKRKISFALSDSASIKSEVLSQYCVSYENFKAEHSAENTPKRSVVLNPIDELLDHQESQDFHDVSSVSQNVSDEIWDSLFIQENSVDLQSMQVFFDEMIMSDPLNNVNAITTGQQAKQLITNYVLSKHPKRRSRRFSWKHVFCCLH